MKLYRVVAHVRGEGRARKLYFITTGRMGTDAISNVMQVLAEELDAGQVLGFDISPTGVLAVQTQPPSIRLGGLAQPPLLPTAGRADTAGKEAKTRGKGEKEKA